MVVVEERHEGWHGQAEAGAAGELGQAGRKGDHTIMLKILGTDVHTNLTVRRLEGGSSSPHHRLFVVEEREGDRGSYLVREVGFLSLFTWVNAMGSGARGKCHGGSQQMNPEEHCLSNSALYGGCRSTGMIEVIERSL